VVHRNRVAAAPALDNYRVTDVDFIIRLPQTRWSEISIDTCPAALSDRVEETDGVSWVVTPLNRLTEKKI
jgi:hypothetical protein